MFLMVSSQCVRVGSSSDASLRSLEHDGKCLHVIDLPILRRLILILHFQDVLQQALSCKRHLHIEFPIEIVVSLEQVVRFLHRTLFLQKS